MKDKNPPVKKNGANGMCRCLFLYAHIAPVAHAIIKAIDRPLVPSHSPPMLISFISPIPIGIVVLSPCVRSRCSKMMPIIAVSVYPNVAPMMASDNWVGNAGKNVISINPISISGNRYASGIIRRLKSVIEICMAQKVAASSKNVKNM